MRNKKESDSDNLGCCRCHPFNRSNLKFRGGKEQGAVRYETKTGPWLSFC